MTIALIALSLLVVVEGGALIYVVARLSAQQARALSDLMDRVSTTPRLELRGPDKPPAPPSERAYISDFEYDDERWNEHRGAPASDVEDAEPEAVTA